MNFEDEVLDRLMRIETRLAQLMKYVGADIQRPNTEGGLIDRIETRLCEHSGSACDMSQSTKE